MQEDGMFYYVIAQSKFLFNTSHKSDKGLHITTILLLYVDYLLDISYTSTGYSSKKLHRTDKLH